MNERNSLERIVGRGFQTRSKQGCAKRKKGSAKHIIEKRPTLSFFEEETQRSERNFRELAKKEFSEVCATNKDARSAISKKDRFCLFSKRRRNEANEIFATLAKKEFSEVCGDEEEEEMSYIYDLVLLAIIIGCFVFYLKQGIMKVLLNFAAFIISLVLAYVLSGTFSTPAGDELLGGNVNLDGGYMISSSRSVAFFVIFIVASIVLGIVVKILQKVINKLPVIGLANKLLGGALGLIVGLVYCYIIVSILAVVILSTGDKNEWVNTTIMNKTFLAGVFYKYNLLTLF